MWHYDEVVKSILVLGWPHDGEGAFYFSYTEVVLPTIAHGSRVFCYLTRGLVLTYWVDRSILLFYLVFGSTFARRKGELYWYGSSIE